MNPTALTEDVATELATRTIDDDLVRVIAAVGARSPVSIAGTGSGALPLSAMRDGQPAIFLRKHSVAIALEPEQARRLHARHGWKLDADDRSTSFVHVPSDELKRPGIADLVCETLVTAFERAASRPRRSDIRAAPTPTPARSRQRSAAAPSTPRRAATAPQRGEMCEIHFMEKSVDGSCPLCDE